MTLFAALVLGAPHASAQSIIRDSEIEGILQEWFAPIYKANNMSPDQVKIILVNSDETNAFVAGGANIFFYTGLIQKTDSPLELIGVMAHELGHISGGHLVRSVEAMEQASYESILGTLVGLGAALATGDAGAVATLLGGGNSMAQRRFLSKARTFESSADQAAIRSMEAAGLSPVGLKTFLGKLAGQELIPTSQQSEYVKTHPLTRDRVDTVQNAVLKSPAKDKAYPAKWDEQHALIKAKLIGFINPEQVPWTYDDTDQSFAANYARVISNYRLNRIESALSDMDALIQNDPSNPYLQELKGQMLVDFSRVEEALPYYKKAVSGAPRSGLIRTAYAHALIEQSATANDNLDTAINELNAALVFEPRNTRIHRLLATAYGRLNKGGNARLHLAQEALLQRRYPYAKQQAEMALQGLKEDSPAWYKARDVLSFIETVKK